MTATLSPGAFNEEEGKKAFQDMAVASAALVFKEACIRILVFDDVIPAQIRAAFKIQPKEFLREAFELAIKEFENDDY